MKKNQIIIIAVIVVPILYYFGYAKQKIEEVNQKKAGIQNLKAEFNKLNVNSGFEDLTDKNKDDIRDKFTKYITNLIEESKINRESDLNPRFFGGNVGTTHAMDSKKKAVLDLKLPGLSLSGKLEQIAKFLYYVKESRPQVLSIQKLSVNVAGEIVKVNIDLGLKEKGWPKDNKIKLPQISHDLIVQNLFTDFPKKQGPGQIVQPKPKDLYKVMSLNQDPRKGNKWVLTVSKTGKGQWLTSLPGEQIANDSKCVYLGVAVHETSRKAKIKTPDGIKEYGVGDEIKE